tara:strand:- start:161 stop:1189 length:1029 start_codon:yes stop_codon:yes gene_type:complete
MKSLVKNCVQVLISLGLFVFLLEAILAFSGFTATAYRTQPVDATSPYIHAKPNYEYVYALGPFGEILQRHKTNNYGFNTEVQFSKYSDNDKVIYIGGSYVEAKQVAPKDSSGSILNHLTSYDVYPIASSRPRISQHLAFAQFAVKEFNPKKIIFLIHTTSYKKSLLSNSQLVGTHSFDDKNGFILRVNNYSPSLLRTILGRSYLVNYLYKNISVQSLFKLPENKKKNVVSDLNLSIQQDELAKEVFLNGVGKLNLEAEDIMFVFIEDQSMVYLNQSRSQKHPAIKFSQQIQKKGYKVLDLHPYFRKHFEVNKQRFDFKIDLHWNKIANRIAADAIMQSGFLD